MSFRDAPRYRFVNERPFWQERTIILPAVAMFALTAVGTYYANSTNLLPPLPTPRPTEIALAKPYYGNSIPGKPPERPVKLEKIPGIDGKEEKPYVVPNLGREGVKQKVTFDELRQRGLDPEDLHGKYVYGPQYPTGKRDNRIIYDNGTEDGVWIELSIPARMDEDGKVTYQRIGYTDANRATFVPPRS